MTITSPFTAADGALTWVGDGETVRIEPWGANSIRVRARFMQPIAVADWALLPPPADAPAPTIVIADDGSQASLTNGGITVTARMPRWDGRCELTFTDADGTVLFKETDDGGALRLKARKYEPLPGGGVRTTVTFDADPHEHLYGMGEYQQPVMDLKGTTLELAHRNSQVSVPFVVSSKGYGFLWHNQVELSYPLVRNVLNIEGFVSADGTTLEGGEISDLHGISDLQWYFAGGFGIKLRIPGFPLGLYWVKNATLNEANGFDFVDGSIFGGSIVLAITTSIY